MPQKACRTCLKLFDNDSQLTSIDSRKPSDKSIKNKLQACVPEIVLNRVPNSHICSTCVSSLNAAYSFKTKCAETERQISKYMAEKTVDTVDLVDFVRDLSNGNASEDDVTIVSDTRIPNCPLPNNSIKCSVCRKSFDSVEQAREHINSHVEDQLRCNICQFQSKSKQAMKDHLVMHKPGEATFKCRHCDFVTTDRKAEIEHYAKHTNVSYYFCNLCAYKSARPMALRRHMKKHKSDALLKCKVCPFVSTDSEMLEKHNEKHKAKKSFSCEHCSFTAQKRIILRRHVRRNHDETVAEVTTVDKDPFHVSVVDIENILKGNILKDIPNGNEEEEESSFIVTVAEIEKMLQGNEKPRKKKKVSKVLFKCSKCELPFKLERMLHRHMERKHPANGKPLHKCNECDFSTAQKAVFKLHMATHSGSKIYSCDKCPFRTVYAKYMQKHERVHTGEKPLKCASCNYKTFVEENMNKHMLLHAEPELLKCVDCPFETTSPDEMHEHTEMHIIGNEFIDNSIHGFLPQF